MKFTNRSGKLRLYDATGTPWFLEVVFSGGDFSGPIGTPRVDEELQLNRSKVDSYAHYIKGPEERLLEPVEISFSAFLTDSQGITDDLLDWLEGGPVNAHTLLTTKGATQRVAGINNPPFADSSKKAFNLEFLLDEGGVDQGWKYAEVYFDPAAQNLSEGPNAVTLQLRGQCYGTVSRIAAFTAGTAVR
jgi:hypothetical protein